MVMGDAIDRAPWETYMMLDCPGCRKRFRYWPRQSELFQRCKGCGFIIRVRMNVKKKQRIFTVQYGEYCPMELGDIRGVKLSEVNDALGG